MGIIAAFFFVILIVDSLIFWVFIEMFRDKEFSEGMGIGEAFLHCGLANILGLLLKATVTSFPFHLSYLFRPFNKVGLNFVAKVLCLILMAGGEYVALMIFAKPLAKALSSF